MKNVLEDFLRIRFLDINSHKNENDYSTGVPVLCSKKKL